MIYGSCAGFHAVDVDSGSVYDIYLPTHVRAVPGMDFFLSFWFLPLPFLRWPKCLSVPVDHCQPLAVEKQMEGSKWMYLRGLCLTLCPVPKVHMSPWLGAAHSGLVLASKAIIKWLWPYFSVSVDPEQYPTSCNHNSPEYGWNGATGLLWGWRSLCKHIWKDHQGRGSAVGRDANFSW